MAMVILAGLIWFYFGVLQKQMNRGRLARIWMAIRPLQRPSPPVPGDEPVTLREP